MTTGQPDTSAVRRRVVVVNDNLGVLDLYRDILRELDYEPVAMATTAIETERIRAHEPDAVILDLEVGAEAMYGVAMAVQLRDDARLANIPIVVCTGNPDALGAARPTLDDIGVPVLLKPFTIDEIDSALSAPVPVGDRPVVAASESSTES